MSLTPPVGQRIREVRLERGITLRGLARTVGVSPSLVSQIETGKSQPSVSTLYAITKALGISIEDVFDTEFDDAGLNEAGLNEAGLDDAGLNAAFDAEPGTADGIGHGTVPGSASIPPAPRAATSQGSAAEVAERRVGPVVRPAQREVLELDSGVSWERLGRVPGTPVDFLLVTYAPGGSSSGTGRLMRHSGVEYGYLIEGELTLVLGFDEYKLVPGDAVSFPSTTPHNYRNEGDRPAIGIWFVDDTGTTVQ